MIKCKICGQKFKNISWKHLKKHNITPSEYKNRYGELFSSDYKKSISERVSGEKNPNFGKKHSQSTIDKIREKRRNQTAWNKGKPMSEDQKLKISESKKETNIGENNPNFGKKHSQSTIDKIKEKRKNQIITKEQIEKALETKRRNGYDLAFFKGKKHTEKSKKKISDAGIKRGEKQKLVSTSLLIEFANKEGFVINDILDDYTWNVTCPNCQSMFNITKQYFYPSKYRGPRCLTCDNNYSYISKDEQDIVNFIKDNTSYEVYQNDRNLLSGKEVDIYIPDLKLAIEYNGLYWHSEQYKNKDYHITKTKILENKGIHLIHIFEDEWHSSKEIVQSRLNNLLLNTHKRIFARKCIVKEIDSSIANKFLRENHIQGSGRSNYRLGLYYNETLVSVMTFSKSNISRKINDWEINRFCSLLNVNVIGGCGKLFKQFIECNDPLKVISYADKRWSKGNVYSKIGFKKLSETPPNYWYFKANDLSRYHRFALRKNENDDQSLTEWQNRRNQGWHRIWDCGHIKFIWEK